MPWKIDITGQRFGRLVAIAPLKSTSQGVRWECICDCGQRASVLTKKLRNGHTKSCGCLQATVHVTHGRTRTPEYRAWQSMLARCDDPNGVMWHRYGGRGIKVCDRWRVFENFFADVGPKPGKGYSLDRIDNDGDYCPSNVRWATKIEQDTNRSTNIYYTYKGVTGTVAQIKERLKLKLPMSTLTSRQYYRWPTDDLFGAPPRARLGHGRSSQKRTDA